MRQKTLSHNITINCYDAAYLDLSFMLRFENTIRGQFFGHTHQDRFEVFFDDVNTTRATK